MRTARRGAPAGRFFRINSRKSIDILSRVWYYNSRKEVKALSKRKPPKKSGNKVTSPESKVNLVTAIIELVIAILMLIEKLTE